nr:MAG TPA: hypothetical protein [Caudoviricetes sp.]
MIGTTWYRFARPTGFIGKSRLSRKVWGLHPTSRAASATVIVSRSGNSSRRRVRWS